MVVGSKGQSKAFRRLGLASLGTVIALWAQGAAAADAPSATTPAAPEPIDYVRVCDAQGTGYFYIPGTQTCMRISGLVYYEYWVNGSDGYNQPGWYNRDLAGSLSYVRSELFVDARTATEFGDLRSHIDLRFNNYDANGSVDRTYPGNQTNLNLYQGYISWNGFTAGRIQSFYDFFTGSTYEENYEPAWSDNKLNVFAYTYKVNDGLNATVSIEDTAERRYGIINAPGYFTGTQSLGYAGARYPDIVGQLNWTQSWGAVQLAAASHDVMATEDAGYGVDSSKMGWAVGLGAQFNLPFLGSGDSITFQGNITQGALSYAAVNAIGPTALVSANTPAGADAIVVDQNGTNALQLANAWSFGGGLTHNFSPQWQLNLGASYLDVSNLTNAYDFTNTDFQANVVFTPINNFSIGAEVEYKYITPSTGPTGNALTTLVHFERDF